jgi:hypothetical protein
MVEAIVPQKVTDGRATVREGAGRRERRSKIKGKTALAHSKHGAPLEAIGL